MARTWFSASHDWRRESLRTTLWVVPAVEVALAVGLFVVTYAFDRAAYRGDIAFPSWVNNGSADAARQILIGIAAAVITVVGLVFSITIVALTLASTQFGPRMLRNFIRDRGTQITLGTFVATFVYAVLALGSVSHGPRGDFVPHLCVTVALLLVLADLGVLIYFIHHVAGSIQLPQVMAGIARDLTVAVDAEVADDDAARRRQFAGLSEAELLARLEERGAEVRAPTSGYLQFVAYSTLVDVAARADSVIRLLYRPGHFVVEGLPLAPRLASRSRAGGDPSPRTVARDRCAPNALPGPHLRHRPAGRDRDPRALAGGERHLHRTHLHRLVGRRALQDLQPVEPARERIVTLGGTYGSSPPSPATRDWSTGRSTRSARRAAGCRRS